MNTLLQIISDHPWSKDNPAMFLSCNTSKEHFHQASLEKTTPVHQLLFSETHTIISHITSHVWNIRYALVQTIQRSMSYLISNLKLLIEVCILLHIDLNVIALYNISFKKPHLQNILYRCILLWWNHKWMSFTKCLSTIHKLWAENMKEIWC